MMDATAARPCAPARRSAAPGRRAASFPGNTLGDGPLRTSAETGALYACRVAGATAAPPTLRPDGHATQAVAHTGATGRRTSRNPGPEAL